MRDVLHHLARNHTTAMYGARNEMGPSWPTDTPMSRSRLKFTAPLTATALGVALSGCATPPPQKAPEADPVGDIIAKYAESATRSLRTLSESEGGSKVVQLSPTVAMAGGPQAQLAQIPQFLGANAAPITREGATTPPPQVVVIPQYYPSPYPVPAQAAPAQVVAPPAPPAAIPAAAPAAQPSAPPAPPPKPAPSVVVATGPAAAMVQPLVRSADRIVYGAGGVTGAGDALTTIPPGLERRITLADVTDDVEGIVERIAKQIGWIRLPSIGIRVSQQPLTVNAVDRPAIEVIRDLGGAVGRNAEIVVTPGNRTLSVQFPVR